MPPRPFTTAAALIALATAPAMADITPAEVWADWERMAERYGLQTTNEGLEETGEGLTVRGAALILEDEEAGSARIELGDIALTDLGDGTVGVDLAEEMPMRMDVPDTGEGPASISLVFRHSGLDMVVSGDAVDRVYDYSADSYGVSDFEIVDPAAEEEVEVSMDLVLATLTGRTTVSGEETVDYSSQFDAETMTLEVTGSGTDEMGQPASFDMSAELRGVFERSTGRFTSIEPDDTPAEMIARGFAADGRVGYGSMAFGVTGEGAEGPFEITGTTENGEGSITMDESGVRYATSAGRQDVTVMGGLPFPVSFSIGESGGSLKMPLVPGEEIQDFALTTRMVDVTIDDAIWNMFDPSGQMARDPASLVLDITGEVIVSEDFLDPAYAETAEAPPGTLEGVSLNELRLEIAGAALTGTGDFDFIQTEMMPQPVGQIDLILKGGNALLDTLTAMGLVPAEQAMGARMMMGLFTVPGEGEDELTTTIEMREDGGVYANGQRVQ